MGIFLANWDAPSRCTETDCLVESYRYRGKDAFSAFILGNERPPNPLQILENVPSLLSFPKRRQSSTAGYYQPNMVTFVTSVQIYDTVHSSCIYMY